MEKYEKRTKYLDYVEHGTKIKNGGVLQTETEGKLCKVRVNVRGLYPTDSVSVEMYLLSDEKSHKVDEFILECGNGIYSAVWNVNDLGGSGIDYEEWDGILLKVSEYRFLKCKWEMQNLQEDARMEMETEKEEEPKPVLQEEEIQATVMEVKHITEEILKVEETEVPEVKKTRFAELYEDKWRQLQQHYRTVRPFGDGRNYLSVTPGDFIVLAKEYQRLVSNSFLLHGYYNYGHLILARIEEKEGYVYYLGVPGIYHEREKQAARMFGFEGFEGASATNIEGGFGYYMLRVEI